MAITKVTNSLVATNAIQGTLIADNAITSVHIAQNQVTSVQIPDSSITAYQLAGSSVGTGQLVNLGVTEAKIANNAVTSNKIATNSVVTETIAQNSITSVQIPDGSITDTQLGSGAFTMGTITTTGALRGPASFTIDPAAVGDNTGTVVIAGNIQVDGTTTTINSTQLAVADLNITVASGAGNASAANNAGLTVAGAGATMLYQSSGDEFRFNKPLYVPSAYKTGTTSTFVGQLTNSGGKLRLQSDANRDIEIGDTNNADIIYVDTSTQKVGIGTNTPDEKLEVNGNVFINVASGNPNFTIKTAGAGNNPLIRLQADATYWDIESVFSNTNDELYFKYGGSTKLSINKIGNVGIGIGTTAPGQTLHVKNATSHQLRLQGDNSFWNIGAGWAGYYQDYLLIANNSGEKVVIDSTGKVAIGHNSPSGPLHVKSSANKTLILDSTISGSSLTSLAFQRSSSDKWRIIQQANDSHLLFYNDINNIDQLSLKADGNIGIGIASPTEKLQVEGTILAENTKLKEIAASNSTAVTDLFIYDTSKDSDGGAWRKKTKHTAWYNEASSSNRSSRKEFPAVAVLAFNLSQELYIYDGDDPDLPLWAKYSNFTQDAGGFASIKAINGSIYCGQASSSYNYSGNGYFQLNFAADYFFSNIISIFSTHRQGRADGLLTTYDYKPRGDRTTPKYTLVGYQVSDLAVRVLDNATIDVETGLPIPNIALATEGGVSIVKDTGTVVDITAAAGSSYNGVSWIDLTENHNLIFEQDNASRSIMTMPIPTSDDTSTTNDGSITDKVVMKFYRNNAHEPYACYNGNEVTNGVALSGDNQVLRSAAGNLTIVEPNLADKEHTKVAYIGHDYNSGWMLGNMKLATLSDTSTTSATSPDLVTNGSTFSNTTGWTGHSTTVSVSNSELLVTGTATGAQNQSAAWTTISCTAGDQFRVTFRISAFVANQSSAGIIVGGAIIHKNNNLGYWYPNTAATHTTTVTATSSTFTLYLHAGISVGVVTRFDDISIHKLQHDRGPYQQGVQTYGTLAKSVVATGAELVGYGPFSTNNYLKQGYTPELDFDTGDFAFCFWTNNAASGSEYICDRAEGNGNYRIAIYLTSTSNGSVYMYTQDGASNNTEVGGIIGTPSKWAQVWCIRRGTSHEIWVNGVNKVATTGTVRDVSNASGDAELLIGTRFNVVSPNSGKIALFRVSGTAPTEDEIKKIYQDERKLFEINADATMAGTSSAATVLAYDDVTEEIHVGSSWGRSVFQGLSRVGYDSDVAQHSISASNGFVVEE